MKKWLILVLCLLGAFWWLYSSKDKPTYISEGEILKNPVQPVSPEIVAPVVNEINARNRDIKAVIYMRIKLRLKDGMLTLRLAGKLDYEKPRNFRSELWHGRSKELDLGSNDKYFWFWSKRMDPPAIFYCKHENIAKSRLRPVFYPSWIIESLGVDEISVKDAQIDMTDRYCKITKKRGALKKTTLIDRHKKAIVGHYLHDQDRLLVSSEVLDFSSFDGLILPTKIKVVWHEENVTLYWDLGDPGYRLMGYPPMFKNWDVPQGDLMIDMKDY